MILINEGWLVAGSRHIRSFYVFLTGAMISLSDAGCMNDEDPTAQAQETEHWIGPR
jgi:hypothetical protein